MEKEVSAGGGLASALGVVGATGAVFVVSAAGALVSPSLSSLLLSAGSEVALGLGELTDGGGPQAQRVRAAIRGIAECAPDAGTKAIRMGALYATAGVASRSKSMAWAAKHVPDELSRTNCGTTARMVGAGRGARGASGHAGRTAALAGAVLLSAIVAACSSSGGATRERGANEARETAKRARPVMPSPGPPQPGYDPVAMNAGCEGCHADIAAENRASYHGMAHTDPVYQEALAIEPLPFCRACHAPEADPSAPVPAALGQLGVACTSCHLSEGKVLAVPSPSKSLDPHHGLDAPPIIRTAAFNTADACAGCHEFPFPDQAARLRPELMQSTVTEHALSPMANVACATCHMPQVGQGQRRHRSHAFSSSRDPQALRRTLTVRAERDGKGLTLFVAPSGVGHAMPTGDLFRRLRVVVEQVADDGALVVEKQRYLTRHFESRPTLGSLRRTMVRDDRPGGRDAGHAPQALRFDFKGLRDGHRLDWRIEHERVLHPAVGARIEAKVARRQLIAQGRVE